MRKFNEYREPEFKVVKTASEDIITGSTGGTLDVISDAWDTGSSGSGSGGLGFGV